MKWGFHRFLIPCQEKNSLCLYCSIYIISDLVRAALYSRSIIEKVSPETTRQEIKITFNIFKY